MAVLTEVHWEAISTGIKSMLEFLGQQDFITRFYLAGGTALALQLGHRESIDLDFFSEHDEVLEKTRQQIISACRKSDFPSEVLESVDGNLLLQINQIHVGFFGYGYPLLAPMQSLKGCSIAGLSDIGLMKMDALISRGSRKDFYDLYWILKQIPLSQLLQFGGQKYPMMRDFPMLAVEHMVVFDNADRDVQPKLLYETPWEIVKDFFIAQVQALGKEWFL